MSRDQLIDGYLAGEISRRTFVRRLVSLGVSLGAALAYVDLLRPDSAKAAPVVVAKVYEDQLPPGAVTTAPSDVAGTLVVLHGAVDPNLRTTAVRFEWGTDAAALAQTLPAPAQEGNGDRDVAALLMGLTPATTYAYRVVATNPSGTTAGATISFTTAPDPPQAVTAPATDLTTNSAILHGSVDPDLQPTDVRFEWGTAPAALTNSLPAAQQAGDGDRDVAAALTGLAPGTVYAYRVVASSPSGVVAGEIASFTTALAVSAASSLPPFSALVVLPSSGGCVSRRKFRIRLRRPKGVVIVKATVSVNGKQVKVVKGRRLSAPVDLRGLPKGHVTVEIALQTKAGQTITGERRYETCAPKIRSKRK